MPEKPTITTSRRLPRQQKGGMPLMLSRAITNLVLAVCESFLNLRVIQPITDGKNVLSMQEADVKITELGAVVTMPALSTGGGGGGIIPFIGAGPPASGTLSSSYSYLATEPPSLYVDTTNSLLYFCTTSGSNSTSVWAKVAGGDGGGCQQFKIVSDGGDWWVVKSWDGTTLGAVTQNICKPEELRCGSAAIASESINGVTLNYAYTAVTISGTIVTYTRATTGGATETCYPIPWPIAGRIIYATPCLQPTVAVPYTILTAMLVNPGTGGTYAVNNILSVAGGAGTAATIKVLTVSAGKIVTFQLLTPGAYTSIPSLSANAVTGGGGSGATFDLTVAPLLLDDNRGGRAWAKDPYL